MLYGKNMGFAFRPGADIIIWHGSWVTYLSTSFPSCKEVSHTVLGMK